MESHQRGILVTGGASGIGLAVVEAFTAMGDYVVSLDRTMSETASSSIVGDVTVPADHDRAVSTVVEAVGRLDVVVVNAGIHDGGVGLETDPAHLAEVTRAVLDVDVLGYLLAIHAGAAELRRSGGCVVMTLSDAAYLAGQTGAGIAYTAAKYAELGILQWCARSLAPEVRVNGVAPGGVITSLTAVQPGGPGKPLFADEEAKRELIRSRNVLGTVLEPDEVARLYVWLASVEARGMTGEVLRPDGGLGLR